MKRKRGNALKKIKQILNDFILNLIAVGLPLVVLQIIVLPFIAKFVSNDDYGYILTTVAMVNVIITATANILVNVRLLMNEEYKASKIEGDFNFILIIMCIINVVVMNIYSILYHESIQSMILTIIYSILYTMQTYLTVGYRINLNYKKILYNSIIMTLGYIVGIIIFKVINYWQIIYILGMIFSIVYQLCTTKLMSEPYKITKLFPKTLNKTIILVITSLSISLMTYLDRLILYPILGGNDVAVYYVASLYGKLVCMILTPISSVLLSYYSKMNNINTKQFWFINIIVIVISIIIFIIGIFIAKPIIGIIYPGLINDAIKYLNIANLAAIINGISTIVQPVLLRFCNIKWQIVIQIIHISIYIAGITTIVVNTGLLGFCEVALAANFIRLLSMFIIGGLSIRKQQIAEV